MPRLKVRKTEYFHDQEDFLQKLREFLQAKGTPLGRLPTFGGQSLDLFALYNTVTSFGGISVVTDRKKWGDVFKALGYPSCTNAAFALKQHYARYLESYERIFFFGEDEVPDPNQLLRAQLNRQRYRRINKPPKLGSLGEPLLHNFDRISYSLQSGLQNEVNFALNICALLSNVTNSIFNLAKSSNILNLILGHVAIWAKDDEIIKDLYKEWFRGKEETYIKFWLESLKEPIVKQLYKETLSGNIIRNVESCEEKEESLFAKSKEVTMTINIQCNRVNQIALILYNFSFEQINAMYMANHEATQRFLLLSSCSTYPNICKNAIETFDNIAQYVTLKDKEESFTQDFMHIVDKFTNSADKFKRGRAMSIIGKLALNEDNGKVLANSITQQTYQILIEMLYLPDIVLILSSLDALYSLSDLCESTATAIASIHGGIHILICLLSIRAESFGNRAIRGYRIVENKHSMFTQKNQEYLKAREAQQQQQHSANMNRYPPRNQFIPQEYHKNMDMMRVPTPHIAPPHMASPHMMPPNISATNINQHPVRHPPPYPRQPVPPMALQPPPMSQQPVTQPQPQQIALTRNMNLKIDEELVEIDPEIYAAHWLSAFYEPSNNAEAVLLSDIYDDFCKTCKECDRKTVLSIKRFQELLKIVLPPNLTNIKLEEDQVNITGVQRRKVPIHIKSNIPKSMHDQLLKNKPLLLKSKEPTTEADKTTLGDGEKKDMNNPVQPKTLLSLNDFQNDPQFDYILKTKNLDSASDCNEIIEQLKNESQMHFTQFHTHRQFLQSLQLQLQQFMMQYQQQQIEQPPDVMKDILMRTQMHHQHMQIHYAKLQAVNNLSNQVQNKLTQNKSNPNTPGPRSGDSFASPLRTTTPNLSVESSSAMSPMAIIGVPNVGTSINYSPAQTNTFFPPVYATTPQKPLSGKGSRGGRGSRSRGIRGSSPRRRGFRGRGSRGSRGKNHLILNGVPDQFNPFPNVGSPFSPPANSPFVTATGTVPNYSMPQQTHPNLQSPFTHSPTSGFLPPSGNNTQRAGGGSLINPVRGPIMGGSSSANLPNSLSAESASIIRNSDTIDFNRFVPSESNNIPGRNETTTTPVNNTVPSIESKEITFNTCIDSKNDIASTNTVSNHEILPNKDIIEDISKVDSHALLTNTKLDKIAISDTPIKSNLSNIDESLTNVSDIVENETNYTKELSQHAESIIKNEKQVNGTGQQNGHTVIPDIEHIHINGDTKKQKLVETRAGRSPLLEAPINEIGKDEISAPNIKNPASLSTMSTGLKPQTCIKKLEHLTNGFLNRKLNEKNLEKNLCNGEIKPTEKSYLEKILNVEQNSVVSQLQETIKSSSYPKMNGFHNDKLDEFERNLKIGEKRLFNGSISPGSPKKLKLDHSTSDFPEILQKSNPNGNLNDEKLSVNSNDIQNHVKPNEKILNPEHVCNEDSPAIAVIPSEEKEIIKVTEENIDTVDTNVNPNGVTEKTVGEKIENTKSLLETEDKPEITNTEIPNKEIRNTKISDLELYNKEFTNINNDIEKVIENTNDKIENLAEKINPENKTSSTTKVNGLTLELTNCNGDLITSSDHSSTNVNLQVDATKVDEASKMDVENMKKKKVTQYFRCLWQACELPEFKKASSLLSHMIHTHAPLEGGVTACKVKGCDDRISRLRGDMIAHFQETHCFVKKEDGKTAKVPLSDKLFRKKHINLPQAEDESPVTRSVRFTAALILRNIARTSTYGKCLIRQYESTIAEITMSASEASSAASDCLAELLKSDDDFDTNPEASESSDVELLSDEEVDNGNDDMDLLTYIDSPQPLN